MLDVFFTVDVEIWCNGLTKTKGGFTEIFNKYVYGSTSKGDFGLQFQVDVLNDHGLTGVFFVEPLFSTHFGDEPLAEITNLLIAGTQEVQLHLHPEWVFESKVMLLDDVQTKRQHLLEFSLKEQTTLISTGIRLLEKAGVRDINAFRAGSFAFNADTLCALAANGIPFDSSYNASLFGLDSGVMPGVTVVEPVVSHGIHEYPMTVFSDGTGSLRHAQLTACSTKEIEGLLWQALVSGRSTFVILSHNFELLNPAKDRPDDVVVKRFRKLCSFLDRNSDTFRVRGFQGLKAQETLRQPPPLKSPIWLTGSRMIEQIYRRRYQ